MRLHHEAVVDKVNTGREPALNEAVPFTAPLTAYYPQFLPAEVPGDGLTVAAWRGAIQPFADDETAHSVLTDIEANKILFISAGAIRGGATPCSHWANSLLIGMDTACDVLICIQPEALPRAYLLSPRFLLHYGEPGVHPHPRGDQLIEYERKLIPGLCVVSGAEFSLVPDLDMYTQFLDQVTQYVAKHLIWLKTRRLCRSSEGGLTVLYTPKPGELILDQPPKRHAVRLPTGMTDVTDFWSGYWPGQRARASTPLEHIKQIHTTQRCWCGLNRAYGACHKDADLALLTPAQQVKFAHKSRKL